MDKRAKVALRLCRLACGNRRRSGWGHSAQSQIGARMAKVKITVRPNGPYRVEDPEGLIELVDASGNPYPLDLGGKPAIALCRSASIASQPPMECASTWILPTPGVALIWVSNSCKASREAIALSLSET